MRVDSLVATAVLSLALFSDSNSCYYVIIRGRGNEKNRRENRERGEGGIDRMHSNKMKANGKKESKVTQ